MRVARGSIIYATEVGRVLPRVPEQKLFRRQAHQEKRALDLKNHANSPRKRATQNH